MFPCRGYVVGQSDFIVDVSLLGTSNVPVIIIYRLDKSAEIIFC